ncbi:OTU domain-containing protein 3-like [Ruditapes philippinarum]|uniref:OTU domain-containing protein 3-like n=1 Tax=Ruditapes philippinarum TaxID=129788 RepID=UPI00295C0665|nr:OTU domain-containing protein 3-like [Ruditapes philippinarum]XP_060600971.1 OTU domain-containing protein 3-like [Ruditapes philippinarum]
MSARRINKMRNQGQGGGTRVHYVRADIVTQKRNERMVREAYRREHKISSYLAEDENFPSFRTQLAKLGLELRDIPGDGNCLFRALGDQYEGHVRNHFRHRQDTVKYMSEHKNDFEPFLSDDTTFERHISGLQKLGTYAGNDAIVAFARLHEVNVIIHQLNSPFLMIQGVNVSSPSTRQLHIAYHNGDHYSSVRKCGDNTESQTNIRLKIGEDGQKSTKTDYGSGVYSDDGVARAVRDTVRLAEEVMNATGCMDEQRVLESLTDCDYDVDATIAYVLQTMETNPDFKDDTTSLASQMTSTDSGIWSESSTTPTKHDVNGNTSQVKGHVRDDSYGGSSGYGSLNSQGGARPKVFQEPKVPVQAARLNSKQTKKMKKMEKKKRAEEKHKLKVQGGVPVNAVDDTDDVVTIISKDLQMAKI